MSDLWMEASRDIEADDAAVVMTQAKMAAASIWPFLAQASSEREFEHRLALAEDRIDLAVPDPVARDHVVSAFREDYKLYRTADSTWDDFDQDSKRRDKERGNELGKGLWDGMVHALGFEDDDHMRAHNQNKDALALRARYKGGTGEYGFDEQGGQPFYKVTHPSGWHMKDYGGPDLAIGHKATGDAEDHDVVNIGDDQGNAPKGLREEHLHQELGDWVKNYGDDYASSIPRVKRWQQRQGSVEPLRIFHEASGQWITLQGAAQPTPGNPQYPDPTPEAGPLTFQTGTYPAEVAPDGHNPLNDDFPMKPTPWTEDTLWVERPMSFAPYRQAAAGYVNEGVETGHGPNPDYFSGGGEGVAGGQQNGFPVDEALPEPDTAVDFYGSTPPLQSGGTTGGDVPYSNDNSRTAKDNHGACFDCKAPVYRKGSDWLHLTPGGDDHPVRLPSNHPWVKARTSRRKATPARGSFFDPADGSVAMVRIADVSSSPMGTGSDGGGGGDAGGGTGAGTGGAGVTPDPPPSMISGGPGAQAMPPMTIPNGSVSTNPFAGGGAGGGGGAGMAQPPAPAAPASPMQPMARFVPRQHMAEIRNRPTSDNPNGVQDEFDANNWEKPLELNPRQAPGQRGVNTPQRPREPINQVSSDTVGRDDEEEGERQ